MLLKIKSNFTLEFMSLFQRLKFYLSKASCSISRNVRLCFNKEVLRPITLGFTFLLTHLYKGNINNYNANIILSNIV